MTGLVGISNSGWIFVLNLRLAQVLNLPVAFGANDFGVSRKDFCVVGECSCHTERVAECHFVGRFNLCGGRTSAFRACQSPRIFLAKFWWCELIESARRFQKAKLRLRRQVRCLIRRETFSELQLGLWARLFVPRKNHNARVLAGE